jgi:CRP-like cAMP-binding protein
MLEIGSPYRQLLLKLDNLVGLSDLEMTSISNLPLTVQNISSHEKHILDGPQSIDCCLVLDGYVYEYQTVSRHGRQIIHLHVPGDIAGLHAPYLGTQNNRLAPLGPAVVAFLSARALSELLDVSPRLRRAFWSLILLEGAMLRERIVSSNRRDALSRTAHLICELTLRLRAVGLAPNYSISIPWTQADIADLTGISTVHANRVVRELRRLGVIEWEAKRVRIHDWETLVRIADFSEAYLGPASIDGALKRKAPAAAASSDPAHLPAAQVDSQRVSRAG